MFFRRKSLKLAHIQGERNWTLPFDVRSVKEFADMFLKLQTVFSLSCLFFTYFDLFFLFFYQIFFSAN